MDASNHRHRVAAERRQRMRARLLASAVRLVALKGPGATSIDDVILEAQVSRGTFYRYFETPEALIRELALEVINEFIQMAEPAALEHTDPAARVATGLRLVIRLAVGRPVIAGFILRLGWPELDGRPLLLDFVRRDLEQGLRQGRFAPMPIALALNIVSATVFGAIHCMLRPGCESDFDSQSAASALRALGVQAKEAQRISVLKLPAARPVEGGLLAYTSSEGASTSTPKVDSKRQAPVKRRATVL